MRINHCWRWNAPGWLLGRAGVNARARVARRNLGPVLLYERRPDGLFQTFHVDEMVLEEIRATQARKAPRLNRGRRTVSRDSGPKRAKLPRKPVENPTFVAFQAQNRALLKRFSEVIEGRVI